MCGVCAHRKVYFIPLKKKQKRERKKDNKVNQQWRVDQKEHPHTLTGNAHIEVGV